MTLAMRSGMSVLLAGILAAAGAPATRADALGAVAIVRAGGCGGRAALSAPLRHSVMLDRLAAQWAEGQPLVQLGASQGYPTGAISGVHVRSGTTPLSEKLSGTSCAALTSPALREIGAFERAPDTWLVLAAAGSPRPQSPGQWVHRSPAAAPVAQPPGGARGSRCARSRW